MTLLLIDKIRTIPPYMPKNARIRYYQPRRKSGIYDEHSLKHALSCETALFAAMRYTHEK